MGGSRTDALIELAPVVFAEAENDDVAAAIVERLAAEIVALARVAITRLDLGREPVEVLLGGGLMRAGRRAAARRDRGGPARGGRPDRGPPHRVSPVVGAALFGLDALGAGEEARERIREELGAAVDSDEELVVSDGRSGDG